MVTVDDVIEKLNAIGLRNLYPDAEAVENAIAAAAEIIKAEINSEKIPEALRYVHIDMATGAFLNGLKATGQLNGELNIGAENSVKKITEGDVSVEYSVSETDVAEKRIDRLINAFIAPPPHIFAAYRKIRW